MTDLSCEDFGAFFAAIHGHALAGGCVLGLCADWRVLRRGALIGLNEVKVGVPLPFGVALIVRDAVPRHALPAVALLGRNFSDEAALAAGLADELAEPGEVEAAARARLEELLDKDPAAFSVTKRYLRSPAIERIRANNRLLLPDHPLGQTLLHAHELVALAFEHAAHRDPGPARYDLGHVFVVDLLL